MITNQEVKARVKSMLGENHLEYYNAKWYLVFDATTPDCRILPSFTLRQLQTKNKYETFTKLDVKILADLENIQETMNRLIAENTTRRYNRHKTKGCTVQILESYQSYAYSKEPDEAKRAQFAQGNALMLGVDRPWFFRDLQKAVRLVVSGRKAGSVGYYEDKMYIDSWRRFITYN